ncbi:uncharacterized protein MELLADRAFT_91192 [Melampsora larici-populina 98AG31]|uniref:No apical meristem-associated C-terminal domain-containing protein n=1 Tax=Melampsora larici-populina (strain 98AG31 / pathotype 3-4-7) TaxID=747676 RepID=F4RY55_MELLP|nr:uncharacterized protein MELLADRAFT_91192 [Melampsora larici-populina 98AG31]EGG02621.1 hypothetical protein MELLADRAFT_91192 [Melampsora larici-populina 98AG31]
MDAKETFLAKTGENFTLEHCWVILRDTKKFQDTSENTLAPFPSSPTSSKNSNTMSATPSNTSQVPKRPSGTKTAKKEAASSKTQEELDRAVLQASEKLANAVAEKGIAIRDLSESRIMMEDPEKMSGHRREWYRMKQEEIMGRYKKVKTNHQTKSETSQTDGDLQTDLDLQTKSESQTNQTDGHWDKE